MEAEPAADLQSFAASTSISTSIDSDSDAVWEFRYEKMRQVPAAFVEAPRSLEVAVAGSCVHVHNMWKIGDSENVAGKCGSFDEVFP